MTALTPRLQPLFEKTRTICFGRFMVDVPELASVAWGSTIIPLTVSIYPDGVDEVNALAKKFIDELKSKKAIYLENVPLLISVDEVLEPKGKVVTGYEGFEAIGTLKINGYFRLSNDGVVINARPLMEHKERATALINSIAYRLRQRAESEIPTEPGNCIENGFLPDSPNDEKNHPGELINIGFRLKEFPDAHFSIQTHPSNPYNPESTSLKTQWKRIKEDPATPEEQALLASIKYFRESPRQIHEWKTGYEVLVRNPDEEGVHSYHDFEARFTGVPHDPFKPYIDIQFQTGVADNAAGVVKPSLTDEEAIAIWDKITSTIRVRPTSATPVNSTAASPTPHFPLGELAATGRNCPQTGWWEPTEVSDRASGQRQHIKAGDRMPHVVSRGKPSMWQKLTGERSSYRLATVWKLVDYDDVPARGDAVAQSSTTAKISSTSAPAKGGATEGGRSEGSSPEREG